MDEKNVKELIRVAVEMRKNSYVPYSNFRVGAALLGKNMQVFTGCNIENGAFSPTNCAERTAFFKAVSEGVKEFEAIAVVGGPGSRVPVKLCSPCGVCRQVMQEFCDKDFKIILASSEDSFKIYTLEELLPLGFDFQ